MGRKSMRKIQKLVKLKWDSLRKYENPLGTRRAPDRISRLSWKENKIRNHPDTTDDEYNSVQQPTAKPSNGFFPPYNSDRGPNVPSSGPRPIASTPKVLVSSSGTATESESMYSHNTNATPGFAVAKANDAQDVAQMPSRGFNPTTPLPDRDPDLHRIRKGRCPNRTFPYTKDEADTPSEKTVGQTLRGSGHIPKFPQEPIATPERDQPPCWPDRQPEKYVMSPQRVAKNFIKTWENEMLPAVEEILDTNCKDQSYTVNLRRETDPKTHRRQWIIDIMTDDRLADEIRDLLEKSKTKSLSPTLASETFFEYREGELEFCSGEEDRCDSPANIRRQTDPQMGDSAGPDWAGTDGGTLGPLLKIANRFFWLVNWHLFDDIHRDSHCYRHDQRTPPQELQLVHPSRTDAAGQGDARCLGEVVAYSGSMYKSKRLSNYVRRTRDQGREDSLPPRAQELVTDWALCAADTKMDCNRMRKVSPLHRRGSFESIKGVADPVLSSEEQDISRPSPVFCAGRSSGFCHGVIGCTLMTNRQKNGVKTREWSIYCPQKGPDSTWISGGIGVLGDSGAGVVDAASKNLVGQVFGRNRYHGPPDLPRYAYFTPILDIFEDIRERFDECGGELPHLAGEEQSPRSTMCSPPSMPHKRSTLNSIDEDGDEVDRRSRMKLSRAPKTGNHIAKSWYSAATSTIVTGSCGDISECRWTFIRHAATY